MTKQRSFASLTEEEINQVAEWLQHGTYDEVRARIAKPRPEGFGLNLKSKRPLETLCQNKNTVDRINRKLAQGEKLTLSEFNAINSGERADLPEKVQDVILETTWEMATSGENTPTQLLALQRLADFPARVEIREQRAELDHKKFEHKQEMDTFRKNMAEKRFDLAEKTFAFRQQLHHDRLALAREKAEAQSNPSALNSQPSTVPQSDHLGRLARTLDDVERRTCEKFNLPYNGPTSSTSSQTSSQTLSDTNGAAHLDSRSEQLVSGNKLEAGLGTHSSAIHAPTASSPQSTIPDQTPASSSVISVPSVVKDSPSVEKSALRTPQSEIESTPALPGGPNIPVSPDPSSPPSTDHSITDYSPSSSLPSLPSANPSETSAPAANNSAIRTPQSAIESPSTQAALDRSCDLFADNPRMKDPPDPRFHPKWLKHPES